MDAAKKDLVLRKIHEHKAITRGALAGMIRLKKEEVESAAKVLEAEGKIKAWPGKRSDSMIYTTPDLPNPLEEIDGKKPAAKKKATPRAAGPAVPRKSQAIPRNPGPVQLAGGSPPKNGGGGGRKGSAELQFRGTAWLDLNTGRPVFGVQAKHDGRYLNVAEDGVPVFFESETARDEWLRERRGTA